MQVQLGSVPLADLAFQPLCAFVSSLEWNPSELDVREAVIIHLGLVSTGSARLTELTNGIVARAERLAVRDELDASKGMTAVTQLLQGSLSAFQLVEVQAARPEAGHASGLSVVLIGELMQEGLKIVDGGALGNLVH